jgi:diguanylate cyclase (GGDEF)-like protein
MMRQGVWRDLWPGIRRLYQGSDTESASLRGAHLGEVLRLTPYAMSANLGSALIVAWVYGTPAPPGLWAWVALMALYCSLALWAWRSMSGVPRRSASRRTLRRATWQAALLAALWGGMAVQWFPGATVGQQTTVATLVTGMIGAGSFVLSPLPLASLAWVGVLSVASLLAIWREGDASMTGVALLVGLYSPMVAIGALASWRKATALIQSQAHAARQEQLLAVALQDFEQQAGDALWETSPEGRVVHGSARLEPLLGLSPNSIAETSLLELVQEHAPQAASALKAAWDAGIPFRDLLLPWQIGGFTRHLSMGGKPLFSEGRSVVGWRGVIADVSARVEAEQRLRQLAHTDSLTGLANRFVLRNALGERLQAGRPVALLLIDLDHFKAVNDNHGHSVGDDLLCQVARRLEQCVRSNDRVARLGGDEFAILVHEPDGTASVQRLALRVIQSLSEPVETGSLRLRVGASVGLAQTGEEPLDVEAIMVQADLALYAAKASGRGRHATYSPALGERSRRRHSIEAELRLALQEQRLTLHWQAKVDVQTWEVVGAEALARWNHPRLGRIGPTEFVSVAEECGLIDELGRWALSQACRDAARQLAPLVISVNVSPLQLADAGFVPFVHKTLLESGLPARQLELEITESVFIDDPDAALQRLHELRALGVRVALDDFGTGFSSLSYLRRFPFDTLKIDRAFVSEVMERSDARAIVQMIVHLATTLGMRTVCEGVETQEQLRLVAEAGCNEVQGYLISAPCEIDALAELRSQWESATLRVDATPLSDLPGQAPIARPLTRSPLPT